MAERRMLSKKIVESDSFLDMPLSAQALYMHLNMNADDDGFVNAPKRIQRGCGAAEDDLKLLQAKRFILPFDSGVIVLKHWKINNYIQKDRHVPTEYQEELRQLSVKPNKSYTDDDMYPKCIQDVSEVDSQYSIVQDSIGEYSLNTHTHARTRTKNGFPQREYSEDTLRRLNK